MQEILGKYKERLINISSKNRSLVLKKLYKKSAFDLYKLKKFSNDIDKEVIEFLIQRKSGKLNIISDPYKWEDEEIRRVRKELKDKLDEKLMLLQKNESDRPKINEYKRELEIQFEIELEIELEKIRARAGEAIDYSRGLTYLMREINSTEKETGRYELYIGYPFVEGLFKDKTFVKAPLFLYPVKAFKNGDDWYIDNINDQSVMLNKVFILAFSKYNNIPLKDIDTEFYDLSEEGLDSIEKVLIFLERNNIKINYEPGDAAEKFVEHTKDTPIDYGAGEFVIKPYLVLGQFPVANSIYNDYIALEGEDIESAQLKKLLINDNRVDATPAGVTEGEEAEKIKEEDFYFITDMDFSQEKAVKMVCKSSELVVYGPPGTGKSQTIANIISDNLSKGKRILMVSQKRAALDVIYNRISDINSKVVLLHDANKDKKSFYEKVTNQLEDLRLVQGDNDNSKITAKARTIDRDIEALDSLGRALHKKRDFGLTLQQMYSKSRKILSKEDPRYEDFKSFRNDDTLHGYKYEEVTNAVEKVSGTDIVKDYIQYKKYLETNEMILRLRQDIDCYEIDDYIEMLENLICKYKEQIVLMLDKNNYSDELLNLYLRDRCVDQERLEKLSREINNRDNNKLLARLNDGRWWSIPYWINYRKNKIQEEINRQEYIKRGIKISEKLREYNSDVTDFVQEISFIRHVLVGEEFENILETVYKRGSLTGIIKKIIKALGVFENYRNLLLELSTLPDIQRRVLEYAYVNSKGEEHMIRVIKCLPEFLILFNINKIEQEERDTLIKCRDYNKIKNEVYALMAEKHKLIPPYIVTKWDDRLCKAILCNNKMERELKRQAAKKRALWPIRKYLSEFHDILFELFPCWLLGPETVSEILPLLPGIFDLIIFDEASQLFVENAIPTIYRGRSVVIAGDDKQLRPSALFKVKYDDEEEIDDIETAAAMEEESLLDLAKVNYNPVHLNYHYRSRYDELINFSNYAFYNGRLEVSPNIAKARIADEKPMERIKTNGRWIGRKNIEEAEKVVEIVEHILKTRQENETIGIITFNVSQKDLIDDMLEDRAGRDSSFKSLFFDEADRKEGNEDVSLFVKNIENVQGDERDIIIFSTGYAKNENGRLLVNFGSLSQEGGENRLNVAVSRAKKKVYVVTSIEAEELSVEGTKNNGPKLLKKYLQYVRAVSQGNQEDAVSLLNSLLDTGSVRKQSKTFENGFENQVYEALMAKGYDVEMQVGVSGYSIDLAVYDSASSRYVLGIECDGAAYHSFKSARERDIHRQRYLEGRGWKIVRIWSKDWWENPCSVIENIEGILKQCIKDQMGAVSLEEHKTLKGLAAR